MYGYHLRQALRCKRYAVARPTTVVKATRTATKRTQCTHTKGIRPVCPAEICANRLVLLEARAVVQRQPRAQPVEILVCHRARRREQHVVSALVACRRQLERSRQLAARRQEQQALSLHVEAADGDDARQVLGEFIEDGWFARWV